MTQGKKQYSGVDQTPWVIKGSTGKAVVLGRDGSATQFKGFKDANASARQYTRETGEFALPVRS